MKDVLRQGDPVGLYRIVGIIGEGGFGIVYEAVSSTDALRHVALKVLRPEHAGNASMVGRLRRECRTLRELRHHAIVAATDFTLEDGTPCLVMEHLRGESLEATLGRGPVPPPEVARVGRFVAEALHAMHTKNLVHRDLKPGNVFRTADGQVKLIDFGGATVFNATQDSPVVTTTWTSPGQTFGSPAYMSPEQVLAEPLGPTSDIFSFGVLLREMLTGTNQFQKDRPDTSMQAILYVQLAPLAGSGASDAQERLAALIDACLQKDERLRPQSARDLALELDDVLGLLSSRPPTKITAVLRPPESAGATDDARMRALQNILSGRQHLAAGGIESIGAAAAAFRTALAEDPENPEAHAGLASTLNEQYYFGWYRADAATLVEAERLAHEAERLKPGHAGARLAMVNIAWNRGTHLAGLEAGLAAIRETPDDHDALEAGVTALCYFGMAEVAIPFAQRLHALDPSNAKALYRLGEAHQLAGEDDAALAAFTEHRTAYELAAMAHLRRHDPAAAIACLNEQLASEKMVNWLFYGEAQHLAGETEAAFNSWYQGLAVYAPGTPMADRPRGRVWRGMLLARAERLKEAEREASTALHEEPGNSYLLYRAACIASMRRDPRAAMDLLRMAVEQGFLAWQLMQLEESFYLRDLANEPSYIALRESVRSNVGALKLRLGVDDLPP